jgi:ketosteroid isomerase-like protein
LDFFPHVTEGGVIRNDCEKGPIMTTTHQGAAQPEDLARLFVERADAQDAEGLAALYEPDAVLAFPPGETTVGRAAIRTVMEKMLTQGLTFRIEEPLPTVRNGDLALTSTRPADGTGGRVQVARRQPDGTWLRVIDRPEIRG